MENMSNVSFTPKENVRETAKAGAKPKAKNVSTKGLDIIIISVIALVFFMTPIFFTGLVAQGIGFEKVTLFFFLVLIGIVAWVTKGVILGELNLKRTPLDLPIIATVVIFAISTITSVANRDSLIGSYGASAKGLVTIIVLALFYYLVVNNINEKRIKLLFWSLLASSSLLVVYVFFQLNSIYLLPFPFTHSRAFNPLGSLSALTMYLVAVLPLFVIAATQARELAPRAGKIATVVIKPLFGFLTIAVLAVLALLNGFTFWPAAVVGVVIVLMFFLAKIISISNNNLIIPLSAFLVLIILLVLGNFNLFNFNLPAEVSLSRTASWQIAKSSLGENPIFGSGPSTFYYDFSRFKSLAFNSSPLWNVRFDSASGIFFELLATVGLLGTVAVVVLVLIALSVSFLTLIKLTQKKISSIILGFFASFISLILLAVLFTMNNSLILLAALLSILATASALVVYPEEFKILKLSFRASPKYALALAAIFLFVSAGVVVVFTMGLKMYLADIYARKAMAAGKTENKINYLNRAVALASYQDSYYLALANNYMALANQAALNRKDQTDIGVNLSAAIENGKKAVKINPNKASNNESLALIYENASFYTRGALEWAEQLYKKVIELEPNNPTPHLRIALIDMARSNAETDPEEKKFYINEAIKKYDEALKKKSDLAAAYYGKAIAYEKLGDNDKAIENLKKANLVARKNIDYRFELGRLYFNRGVIQPKIDQTATEEIAENDITPEGKGTSTAPKLSVKPTAKTGGAVNRNADLNTAEQIFLSILAANPKHANAAYSLAVLYQKIGEKDKAKAMVTRLLNNILTDERTKQLVRDQFKDLY
jgi:tetratricopeptide (TPR) repeat protein